MDSNQTHITQELLEAVERYYNGSMSEKERLSFNEKLNNDPDFKAKVDDIKTLIIGIETANMEDAVSDFHKAIPSEKKHSLYPYKKLAIAAVFIIGLVLTWYLTPNQNERLYSKHFTPDPGLPTTMSNTNNYAFYDAMVYYKHGDYEVALNKWHTLLESKPKNDTLNYFIGMTHMANQDLGLATPFLQNTPKESVFYKDAQYYLGLIELKSNNIESALNYFKTSGTEKSQIIINQLQ